MIRTGGLKFLVVFMLAVLPGLVAGATVILNSQDYSDILAVAAYAKANDHSYVFSLTPNQSIFIAKYYTLNKNDTVIYVEGKKPILPNMASIIKDASVAKTEINKPENVQLWAAERMKKDEAIIVGSAYGQDALSVISYSILKSAPIFFIDDPSNAGEMLGKISAMGYKKTLVYGTIAHQVPKDELSKLSSPWYIDTGNRYMNNLKIAEEYMASSRTSQVMFVSGRSFEKSMADRQFPLILVGRSDVPSEVSDFIRRNDVRSGVVFSGDSDIIDGVGKLRAANPQLSLFVKFGEGYLYRGQSTQPLPLMIVGLPSPTLSLEVINLTYNIPLKSFELKIKNHKDFVVLSSGVSVTGIGAAESSQIMMDPGTETSLIIPLDATNAVSGGKIKEATLSIKYGEDVKLTDNLDTITFTDVPVSYYNDTSDVRLVSVNYLSSEKAFAVQFDGKGYVSGTLRFTMNQEPITLRFNSEKIDGPTIVRIKYFLSNDEEKFVNGLPVEYFMRVGDRADILLKEMRGQSKISVPSLGQEAAQKGESPPFLMICAILAIVTIVVIGIRTLASKRGDSFE